MQRRTGTHGGRTCLRRSQKNKRSHANPQMCREAGGRWGGEDWEEECLQGGERGFDGGGGREGGDVVVVVEGEGWVFTTI